jgi:hypothetical protein
MHLCISHLASWYVVHHVKEKHHLLRVVYKSEKTRIDQVSEKVHPPVVLIPSLTLVIRLWN